LRLQNAGYVLTTRGTGLPGSAALGPKTGVTSGTPRKRGGALAEGLAGGEQQQLQQQQQQQSRQQTAHPLLADLGAESIQAAVQWLFGAGVILEDSAFHDFVGPLCKLSLEMGSMQNGTDFGSGVGAGTAGEGTLDTEDDTISSGSTSVTSLVGPCTELFSRRRVRGIHIPRTLMRRICTCYYQNFFPD